MRRHRRRRKKNKIIIFSTVGLLLIMTIGYAAFNTQLNIKAKGNVLKGEITTEELKNNVVTSGDGLYADTTEVGRYFYKGTAPNNYIIFNDETWRIMSVESDNTIKIIRNENIGSYAWDEAGTRNSSTSTYCQNASGYGCSAWAATTNLVGTPSEFILHYPNGNPTSDTEVYSGTVIQDASVNTYLNGEYYNSLLETSKNYIVSHEFNVGTPGDYTDTEDIATNVLQEALYKWNGKIGLMTVTEFLKASTTVACDSLEAGFNSNNTGYCNSNNWLFQANYEWTISPFVSTGRRTLWLIFVGGRIDKSYAIRVNVIRPVVYLSSDITLSGSGTESDPYQISAQ